MDVKPATIVVWMAVTVTVATAPSTLALEGSVWASTDPLCSGASTLGTSAEVCAPHEDALDGVYEELKETVDESYDELATAVDEAYAETASEIDQAYDDAEDALGG